MINSALAMILIVFFAILLLSRLRVHLGVALVLGGLVLNLWSGIPTHEALLNLADAFASSELWLLVLVTALVLDLGRYTSDERNAKPLMAMAQRWGGRHGRAVGLMVIPSVIGLIPMPGGALVSAPFVQQTVREDTWRPGWKVAVNYWFRHTWEYWWPLFPVVIVTLSLFELETWKFMLVQGLFTPLSIASGYVFLIRPHLGRLRDVPLSSGGDEKRVWMILLPLLIVVACTVFLPMLVRSGVPALGLQERKLVSMLVGVVVALLLIRWDERGLDRGGLGRTLKSRKTVHILATLGGVLVFKSLLEATGLLPRAGNDLVASGIPLPVVIALLPFVAGLVTGIAIGFAGAAFPLVAGLVAVEQAGLGPLSTLVLAFSFGYAGMMLSPVHLCFALTKEYFAAPYRQVYTHLIGCIGCLVLAGMILSTLLHAVGW